MTGAIKAALDLHDRAGCFCCDNLPAVYADKDGAYHDAIYQSRIDLLKAARAELAAMHKALEAGDSLADQTGAWVRCDDRRLGSIKTQKAVTAYRAARGAK